MALEMPSLTPSPKFFFPVSFKKFHVTVPKRAGHNRIYNFKRSKSFLFELADNRSSTNDIHLTIHTNDYHMKSTPIEYPSTSRFPNIKYQMSIALTHFFSQQRVLPRRIQQKYFQLIRSKLLDRLDLIKSRGQKNERRNTSTKSFFNFSYKCYRFHFGIYVPCNHLELQRSDPTQHVCCKVPSPFIMSNDRRACGYHHRFIEKYNFIKKPCENLPIPSSHKAHHANLLFNSWQEQRPKTVFSLRQGTSYKVRYQANGHQDILTVGNRYMYRKTLEDFSFSPSSKPRTKAKQDIRFQRACRRVFSQKKEEPALELHEKIHKANQQNFIFRKSQYAKKQIKHLRYNRNCRLPSPTDYNFSVPYFSLSVSARGRITVQNEISIRSPSQNLPIAIDRTPVALIDRTYPSTEIISLDDVRLSTVKNFDPFPPAIRHRVVSHLRPFIPQTPLYIGRHNQTYCPPGTYTWIRHLHRLYDEHYEKIKEDQRRQKKINREVYHERRKVAEQLAQEQSARLHGTTVHRLADRDHKTRRLMEQQDNVHARGTELRNSGAITPIDRPLTAAEQIYHKHWEFIDRYPKIHSDIVTSDETKAIEHCPNKRNSHTANVCTTDSSIIANKKSYTETDSYKRYSAEAFELFDIT